MAVMLPLLSCSSDSSEQTPPTATLQPTIVTPSPLPAVFTLYGATLADVDYCSMGAVNQKMDIYFPASGGPWPVLAYVHGGSWMHGDKSEAILFAARMTSQGYLVVSDRKSTRLNSSH